MCALLFGTMGCDKDDDDSKQAQLTARELTNLGWDEFKGLNYSAALLNFNEAKLRDENFADAYNGAGWALGRLPGQLHLAGDNFARCLQLDTTRYDAIGGWSFTEYQLGNYISALNKADSLLQRRSGWRFLHQPEVDFRRLRLMKASAYYSIEQYEDSYEEIINYLNYNFEADISTLEGRRELLAEIERLRRIYG